jgi:hypothetical protein
MLGAAAGGSSARAQSADFSPSTVPVFVNDFELYSVASLPGSPRRSTPGGTARPSAPASSPDESMKNKVGGTPLLLDSDTPSVQAQQLTDFFAVALVQTLQKSGYSNASRRGQAAKSGAMIRGVFAEPDAKNRIRRALLGGNAGGAKFLLYVGIFNLGRPDQPLYQLAAVQPPEPQFGPIISLNSYIPLAKYELSKNPTEDDVRKICAQIADSLTALLQNNPAAFSQ